MAQLKLTRTDALIIVDCQRDFCAGGALAVPNGDDVVPVLNAWIGRAEGVGCPIFASRDWHPKDHVSFVAQGGPWPEHCVAGTDGATFHPDLNLPESAIVVSKATESDRDAYSAFDGTDLARQLEALGIERVLVGGLALDYCVKATALDARANGFATCLLIAATRPVDAAEGDGERAFNEMIQRGVIAFRESS